MTRPISLLILILCTAGCFSDHNVRTAGPLAKASPTQPSAALATLTIRVTDLRNHNGQIIFAVFKSAEGFPKVKEKAVSWELKPADANTVIFTALLPPGRYAASALHDENRNNRMDLNFLGVPEEGYGVTNNPKPKYRQARFDEAVFDLPQGGTTLTISLQYFRS